MPAVYDKLGIRFLYPDNWTLDEDAAMQGEGTVSVHSPGGAFWSIALHPANVDPSELAATALQTLKAEYPDSEAEPASESYGAYEARGYDLHFFYLDFISTAVVRTFRTPTASCLVLCQAEDREFAQLAEVFRAITSSLLGAPMNGLVGAMLTFS